MNKQKFKKKVTKFLMKRFSCHSNDAAKKYSKSIPEYSKVFQEPDILV